MRTKRNIQYIAIASIFTLTLMIGAMILSTPVQAQAVSGDLTSAEIDGLQFMLEEEKLARDVYLTLDEQWNLRVYQNISRAEQQHMDAVAAILDRYGITDPTAGKEIGAFTDPDLQTLYDQLVATGSRLSPRLSASWNCMPVTTARGMNGTAPIAGRVWRTLDPSAELPSLIHTVPKTIHCLRARYCYIWRKWMPDRRYTRTLDNFDSNAVSSDNGYISPSMPDSIHTMPQARRIRCHVRAG